jgi:DNA-binding SARP family transcriptional activator
MILSPGTEAKSLASRATLVRASRNNAIDVRSATCNDARLDEVIVRGLTVSQSMLKALRDQVTGVRAAGVSGPRTETMLSPEHLEVTAHSLTAILGVWLGLTVLTRSRAPASRVFGLLALALVAWSSSVIIQRLATSVAAVQAGHGIEELAAAIIVPATAHFALIVATEGHPSRRQLRVLAFAYLANVLFAIPGVANPAAPIAIGPPQLNPGLVPGALLGWAWILTRLATLWAATWWLLDAFRRTSPADPRRRQLGVTLATVAVGALGGIIRIFSVVGQSDPWIGVSLVTVAMALSASVVFSGGVFFAADVAGRAFWASLALGVGVFVLVGALLAVDAASRRLLGLDVPLLTILALVVIMAIYEPVATWSRTRLAGRSPAMVGRARLLAILGEPALSPRAADAGVQPALARMTRTLDLAGAVVVRRDGSIAAAEGNAPEGASGSGISLVASDELVGELRVGRTLSGSPLSAEDQQLLRLSAAYVAAALRTGRREDEQLDALSELTQDRAHVDLTAARLHEALVRRSLDRPGLRVFALGPLNVTRGDSPIERWGGEKAGTRQAQGLFAFLLDRGERGVEKDEALELIWPDVDVDRADLAFHRTLGGLRRTVDPDGGAGKQAIRFHNDRYRLAPSVISWSDVETFLGRLEQARSTAERAPRLRLLEEARALYRGEYLDDCPFYGDSVYVEDRRVALRGHHLDLLIALGEAYEASGDRSSASAAFREAVAVAADGCPPAVAGLARIAVRS